MKSTGQKLKRRGYTLTELAIVLAIAGFLMATIWSMAAHVRNNKRIAQASQQVMTVVQEIREFHMGRQGIDAAVNEDIVDALAIKGVPFPVEMKIKCRATPTKTCLNSAIASDPNGTFFIRRGATPSRFLIVMTKLTQPECIGLLSNAVNYLDQTIGVDFICAGTNTSSCAVGTQWKNIETTSTGVRQIAGGATIMGMCTQNVTEIGWDFDLRK